MSYDDSKQTASVFLFFEYFVFFAVKNGVSNHTYLYLIVILILSNSKFSLL